MTNEARLCDLRECTGRHHAGGWCQLHYRRDRKRHQAAWVSAYKEARGCEDGRLCGRIKLPAEALDLDHVHPGKTENVSTMIGRKSDQAIRDELALCEVVCSNCHRLRTAERRREEPTP